MKNKCMLILCMLIAGIMNAQDFSLYQKKMFRYHDDSLPYRLLLPKDYDPAKKYPLIYFLHGAGERGTDNQIQLTHGAKLFLKDSNRINFPAIVVFPQCPTTSFWSNVDIVTEKGVNKFAFSHTGKATISMEMAEALLMKLLKEYPVEKKQVYVGGLSMGGMGTFEIVRRHPKVFAAAFPICGGGSPETARLLKKTSWWVFHGGKDNVVDPHFSDVMVKALEKVKADVKYTFYPEANHNSWDPAFAEPDLLPWLFSRKK